MLLLISLFVLCISSFLFKKAAGTLSVFRLNLISWNFYFQIIIQTFIASVLVVYAVDEHYVISSGVVSEEVRFYGWLSVQYCMIALPISMNLVRLFFKESNNDINFTGYCNSPVCSSNNRKDKLYRQVFFVLSVFSLLSVFYIYFNFNDNPLVAFFTLGAEELARVRTLNSIEFSGNVYIKNLIAYLITPVLSYVAFTYYFKNRTLYDLFWFLFLFCLSCLVLISDLSKAPIIQYFLSFIFIFVLLKKRIKFKYLALFFLISILLLIVFYSFLSKTHNVGDLLFSYNAGIWGRLLLTQAAGTYLTFEYFPETLPFIGFDSLSHFIGTDVERSARQIMEQFDPVSVENGTAGVINSLFVAEAWANFGLIGVILSPIIVGIYIQVIYQLLITGKKTPVKIALYAYFVFHIPVTGGFNDFFYSPGLIFVLLIFGTLYLLRKGFYS